MKTVNIFWEMMTAIQVQTMSASMQIVSIDFHIELAHSYQLNFRWFFQFQISNSVSDKTMMKRPKMHKHCQVRRRYCPAPVPPAKYSIIPTRWRKLRKLQVWKNTSRWYAKIPWCLWIQCCHIYLIYEHTTNRSTQTQTHRWKMARKFAGIIVRGVAVSDLHVHLHTTPIWMRMLRPNRHQPNMMRIVVRHREERPVTLYKIRWNHRIKNVPDSAIRLCRVKKLWKITTTHDDLSLWETDRWGERISITLAVHVILFIFWYFLFDSGSYALLQFRAQFIVQFI